MADPNYYRALNYYQRHSNENTLRKIQNFLYARGYYQGELNGKFSPQTYQAIRDYQKKYGLKDDGMWGEATNSAHRLLNAVDAPYRNDASGSSGAHTQWMQGVNTGSQYQEPAIKTDQDLYKAINALKTKFYSEGGDSWFWSDDPEASSWRQFLQKTKQGQEILNEFYDNTTDPSKIGNRYLTNAQKGKRTESQVQARIDRAGHTVAKVGGATAALLTGLAAPLATAGALAGGYAGSRIGADAGETIGRDLYRENETHAETQTGMMGTPRSIVMPAQEYGAQRGRAIGEVAGGTVGSLLGGAGLNYAVRNFNPRGWYNSMSQANYGGVPSEIQEVRIPAGVHTAQLHTPQFGGNVRVYPGSVTGGYGVGSNNTMYPSVGAAVEANPGVRLSGWAANSAASQDGAPVLFPYLHKKGGKLIKKFGNH
jgi:peptidoglycan hydrolase-like protein with peptidoglycan-binding domain